MNTSDARLFVRLAESQSFKKTAAHLNISRGTVSKRIASLEKKFGAILIHRNSRSISLTQAGNFLLEQCRRICEAEDMAFQTIQGHGLQPVGTLHIVLPTSFGSSLLPSLIREFAQSYSKVNLSVHFANGDIDVIGGGYDLAIMLERKLDDSNLTAQRLLTTRPVLVASPGYLEKHGVPTDVAQLAAHKCLDIGYASSKKKTWRFDGGRGPVDVDVRCSMTSNSYAALNLAACLDMGFLYVPELIVNSDICRGRLKVVLPEFAEKVDWGLFAVYPSRQSSPKTKALVDFIKARVPFSEQVDKWSPLSVDEQQIYTSGKAN